VNKTVHRLKLHKDVPYIQDNACYPFFDTDGIPCQADQEFSLLHPKLAHASLPHLFTEIVLVKTTYIFRRGIAGEDVLGGLYLYIVEDRFVFREDEKYKLLELVEKSGTLSDMPFSRIVQPPEVGCIAFGDNNTQGVTETQHICYHPGIFIVCLQRRVVIQLFDSLRVHGIDLDDPDGLIHEIVDERLGIGTG
jgi:hypothetical protein